jgi:hypothetical protein
MCIVLEAAASFGQQLRSHRQITLGRVQVRMSEIDGQRRQKDLHVRASPIPFRQSVDGERVAKMSHSAFSPECRVLENAESHSGICWKQLEWKHLVPRNILYFAY